MLFEMFVNFGATQMRWFQTTIHQKVTDPSRTNTNEHESKLRYLMPNINIIKYVFNSAGKLR